MSARPVYGAVETLLPVGPSRKNAGAWKQPTGIALAVASVLGLGYVADQTRLSSSSTTVAMEGQTGTMAQQIASRSLATSDDYTKMNGYAIGEGMYPFEAMAEIYRETVLGFEISLSEDEESCAFEWSVHPDFFDDADWKTFEGPSPVIEFQHLGLHTVKLTVACGDADTATVEHSVYSTHVRREIRTMTTMDRNMFFGALEAVYKNSQDDGEARWGLDFRSIETLVANHLEGAADKMCDHWHDDAGIMSHHMAFTLELEQSLQSINKKIAMPYWDYTWDAYAYSTHEWYESEIFDPSWFGRANPNHTDHVMKDGRWAYLSVMKGAGETSKIHNPYDLLRSPWNTNPVPYVTRSRYVLGVEDGGWGLPTCTSFKNYFQMTELSGILSGLNGELHGPVHIMVGGHWWNKLSSDIDDKWYNLKRGLTKAGNATQSSADFLLSSKYLWREGYLKCPDSCSHDTPATDCACHCQMDNFKGETDYKQILNQTGLLNLNGWLDSDFVDASNITYQDVFDAMCHVGHAGEMFTSAAPYDPLFWPIHGLAERFLSFKRLKAYANETTLHEEWGYQHISALASDTNRVCDWSNVTSEMQMPFCYPGTCPGHKADDVLPMQVKDAKDERRTMSNQEFYMFSKPGSTELPYAYDSFTKWKACIAQDIHFF